MSVLVSATSNAGFRPEHTVWSVARAPQLGVGPNTNTVREDRAVEHTSIEDGALPNKRRIDSLTARCVRSDVDMDHTIPVNAIRHD
ncbi:hypothetical protein SCP_0803670 [Sparassis crispa]|uniref:Uncharacterized protein n=1 Tax=Sparassis crispa TaxID=139825 RepID=A0A401GUD1_9APHY|nr:hypothetical protein SCP_0803670 [Sparassis crispa]GBE85845.1 hypothetical protein SCP_0803670 [Sparassis crispa]